MLERSLTVDVLKVVAAQFIVWHHFSAYGPMADTMTLVWPHLMEWLYRYARLAVQVFLVVGGYLAAQSVMYKPLQNPLISIAKRYLRLVPFYVFALALISLAVAVSRNTIHADWLPSEPTLWQFVAHGLLLHDIFGFEALSSGAWYVAIDWQLYAVLAVLLISFSSYQALIWLISIVAVSSLLYFNRSAQYEAYFIYFIGSYGLGVLAYLAKNFADKKIQVLAKFALIAIGLIIAISTLHEVWLRNFLAWFVALLLLVWGNVSYPSLAPASPKAKAFLLRSISWASPRSYCAFLIHFAFILLANTLYIASGMHSHESGLIAIGLMLGVVVCSTIAASYLYRLVELPSAKLKI